MELPKNYQLLSHKEKDNLIVQLWNIIQSQEKQIADLKTRVDALDIKLSKNSGNSSKPPSQDGFNKPSPKSRRNKNKKKKKVGGQPGHPGKTLRQVAVPDFTVEHDPINCWLCS